MASCGDLGSIGQIYNFFWVVYELVLFNGRHLLLLMDSGYWQRILFTMVGLGVSSLPFLISCLDPQKHSVFHLGDNNRSVTIVVFMLCYLVGISLRSDLICPLV